MSCDVYALYSERVLPVDDVNECHVTRDARMMGSAFKVTGEEKGEKKYGRTCAGELHLEIFQTRHEFFYSSYARVSEQFNLMSISQKCIELSLEMQSINKSLHAGYDYGSWVRDFSTRFVEAQPNTRIAQFYPSQGRELRNTLQERFIASKSIVLPTLDSERYNMLRRSAETV